MYLIIKRKEKGIMKKKILSMVLLVAMCVSLCACGTKETETKESEKEVAETTQNEEENKGFVPTQIEKEVEEEISIDTENLEQYYDSTRFIGTPRLDEARFFVQKDENTIKVSGVTFTTYIEYTDELDCSKTYQCIVVDNNTGTIEDDVLAYIFK